MPTRAAQTEAEQSEFLRAADPAITYRELAADFTKLNSGAALMRKPSVATEGTKPTPLSACTYMHISDEAVGARILKVFTVRDLRGQGYAVTYCYN